MENKMGVPDETSWMCENCDSFNIQDGIIDDGHMYCKRCWEMFKEQKRSPTRRWQIRR